MKEFLLRTATFIGVLGALVVGTAGPAFADDLNAVANQLQTSNVYGTHGIPGIDGSSVGVVVLSGLNFGDSAPGGLDVSGVANKLIASTHYKALIVVNSDASTGMFGVAGANSSNISELLYSSNTGDPIATITTKALSIKQLADGNSTTTSSHTVAGFNPGALIGDFADHGGFIAIVLIVAVGVTLVLRRKRFRAITTRGIKQDNMRAAMEELGRLTEKHTRLKYPTATIMKSILTRLNELFDRLDRKGAENQKALAAVEYTDIIQKLNAALGSDYYLDIAGNDTLWDRSTERLQEVEAAATAVDNQILLNIRQVNSAKDLDFRVGLDSILRSVDQPNASDMIEEPKKGKANGQV